jgi:hypothetical protein
MFFLFLEVSVPAPDVSVLSSGLSDLSIFAYKEVGKARKRKKAMKKERERECGAAPDVSVMSSGLSALSTLTCKKKESKRERVRERVRECVCVCCRT